MKAKPRAALYARYSTDMQNDASVADQFASCEKHATRQGIDVTERYSDHATSGASLLRQDIQRLLTDAATGTFDVVIAEGLDRLSRNQADIATLYQHLQFHGVRIETLSEGDISELHIGLKGTMNALFLKDLAIKTHRGLEGRAKAGKSAGGKSYGYTAVQSLGADGTVLRGDRKIDPGEAAIIRRIFKDYATGISPKKIAEALNDEGIPAPSSKYWGASTIYGNRQRGTGLLNNELYIGRQVWNRQTYVKDPATGKRVSRPNPESDWVITNVPNLRIIPQDLWNAAKERQGALTLQAAEDKPWDRRRPRYLLSKLLTCGCCGGGMSMVNKTSYGCSQARNKGPSVCTNKRLIKREELEDRVLNALTTHLMQPEALEQFCEAYIAERNRLACASEKSKASLERELHRLHKEKASLIASLKNGVPAEFLKDDIAQNMSQTQRVEAEIAAAREDAPVRFHPKMADVYRARVTALIRTLGDRKEMAESWESLRGLIEKITLIPHDHCDGYAIDLQGDLGALLNFATGTKAYGSKGPDIQVLDNVEEVLLVAGVGFEPTTFRL